MKSSLKVSSAIKKAGITLVFLPVISLVYPEVTLASSLQNATPKTMVFEINPNQNQILATSGSLLTYSEIASNDPLVLALGDYLESKKSPLAPYAHEIVQLPQWQRALAISFVESNFCKMAKNHNCGSLGVAPGHRLWRKYQTPLDGIKDLSALLEKPIYKERFTNCKKMLNVYVVPGSSRWLGGCNKVSDELVSMTKLAENQRYALSQTNLVAIAETNLIFK